MPSGSQFRIFRLTETAVFYRTIFCSMFSVDNRETDSRHFQSAVDIGWPITYQIKQRTHLETLNHMIRITQLLGLLLNASSLRGMPVGRVRG
ncbi:TPA: leu operon leader peptide [Serratia odorifera]|nr:leu operon leader peptide [Serratia odorifera]